MTHPAEVRGSAGTGLAAAFGAAVVGGLVWALITITTNYKIGLVAVGIGLLVGKAVEHFGGGDARLPVPAAVLALVGCAIGSLFSDIHVVAQAVNISDTKLAGELFSRPGDLWQLFRDYFEAMDLVFYAIAAYEGFRFAQVGVAKAQYARAQAAAAAQAPPAEAPSAEGSSAMAPSQPESGQTDFRPGEAP